MNINYAALQFWVTIVQFFLTFGFAVYVRRVTKTQVTNKRITDLEKAVAERCLTAQVTELEKRQNENCNTHKQRTAGLEVSLGKSPSHSDLGEIHEKINHVDGAVKELSGMVRAINVNMKMLVEHHLNEGKK